MKLVMERAILLALLVTLLPLTVRGEEVLKQIAWNELKAENALPGEAGVITDQSIGEEVLRVDVPIGEKVTKVLTIHSPDISMAAYSLRGKVRYEGISGDGFLEMLNYFGGGTPFFTRTTQDDGPLGKLSGTSEWRTTILPFQLMGSAERPQKLELLVHLPEGGTVYLSGFELVQFPQGQNPLSPAPDLRLQKREGDWVSPKDSIYFGAFGGSFFGIVGGLIGVLCSLGRGRSVVFGLLHFMRFAGVAFFILGIVALIDKQSWPLYYSLLLMGVILSLTSFPLYGTVKKRFEEIELRKMSSQEF